ncbi:hypothetical protein EXIGLDRAFT_770263 [Exidia glandulosa HHB12029]|uniref:Uncharacterized protein n=1 Tax=Exidia glandulosa HHB12029 TaxID=1314781 RepID=A0A165GWE1_EXIGL|nr:hypothetical protein EXIGLDRAFT_770263 [Exidia glandulosa HHB12029]
MGGAASKARKLPSAASGATKAKPALAGARAGDPTAPSLPPRASGTRTAAIDADAKDPQLLANLSKLGQVAIESRSTSGTSERISRAFAQQVQSEDEGARTRPPRNKLHASALAQLLDELRDLRTNDEVAQLAERYNMDLDVLERLAQVVNTPSIDRAERTVVDGQQRLVMNASWIRKPKMDAPRTRRLEAP